jgi:hypothetical protein
MPKNQPKFIGSKTVHEMLEKLTPGTNFTEISRGSFAPVDLC